MMNVKLLTQNVPKECWKDGQSHGSEWHAMSSAAMQTKFVQAIGSGFEQIAITAGPVRPRKE